MGIHFQQTSSVKEVNTFISSLESMVLKQIMPLVFILGFINAILEYREMFQAFSPH